MKRSFKTFFVIILASFAILGIKLALAEIPIQNSDGEVLGVVGVIDQNEIQAAQLATQKKIDPKIIDYARMLNDEHSKNLTAVQDISKKSGISIVDNTSAINQLRTKGEQDLEALTKLDGNAFAQLYIADMIKGHAEALTWIDNQGIQNGDVKKFLIDTREHVDMHMKKAEDIQKHQNIGQT